MPNALQSYGGQDDDGFNNSPGSGNPPRANYLKWDNENHWRDRDGPLPPELILWLLSLGTCLRRWQGGLPTEITDHPLPDVDEINASIPESEWEDGVDGRPRPPWEHTVKANFVHPGTGEFYVYAAATVGAQIAHDSVKSSVIAMRAMKGLPVVPVVRLSEKPMQTKFGRKSRPHFEIVGWETPGGNNALPSAPLPQLVSGSAEPAEPEPEPAEPEPVKPAGAKGRKGLITITSGRQSKSKIQSDLERRRPDLKRELPDPSDPNEEIPF